MIAKKLKSLKGLQRVLIMPHDNPDPDAIASSWGIRFLLRKEFGIASTIAYGGLIGRAENRAMVNTLRIPLALFSPPLIDTHQAVIMVDCQPYTGNSSLPEEVVPDIIIDHHPLRKTTKYRMWAYFNERIGTTSTIITSSIKERRLPISKRLATALFYAIKSETKDLGWMGTKEDYQNYLFLLPRVDFKALYRITYPPLSSDYYRSVKEAVEKSRTYDFVIVCPLGRVPYPELPAEIADFLIFKENIDFSLVIGFYGEDIVLSIRSLRPDVNSADLMQKIIKGYGRGGGHGVMAGGKIPDVPFAKFEYFEKILTGRFLKALSLSSTKAKRLF